MAAQPLPPFKSPALKHPINLTISHFTQWPHPLLYIYFYKNMRTTYCYKTQ